MSCRAGGVVKGVDEIDEAVVTYDFVVVLLVLVLVLLVLALDDRSGALCSLAGHGCCCR